MFCSKDILLSCCDLKMVLNAFHQWSPGPIFGPKIFIFFTLHPYYPDFLGSERSDSMSPYPEVTLDNFGFLVGNCLAAWWAIFQPPCRILAIFGNSEVLTLDLC